jgi:putative addiction module killer protein
MFPHPGLSLFHAAILNPRNPAQGFFFTLAFALLKIYLMGRGLCTRLRCNDGAYNRGKKKTSSPEPLTIIDTPRHENYNLHMVKVIESETFKAWMRNLRDDRARARIALRLRRLEAGNAGDVKSVGDGLSELRIDYGPGYRVYFMRRGAILVVVLCGGDKRTQEADIKAAKRIAAEWKE